MKKLLIMGALVVVMIGTTLPMVAEDCCEYEGACREVCCAEQTYWFEVSYFERVPTGYFFHGVEMTSGVWTHKYVEAHDRNEAAEMLGKEAGYGCFVSRAIGYEG